VGSSALSSLPLSSSTKRRPPPFSSPLFHVANGLQLKVNLESLRGKHDEPGLEYVFFPFVFETKSQTPCIEVRYGVCTMQNSRPSRVFPNIKTNLRCTLKAAPLLSNTSKYHQSRMNTPSHICEACICNIRTCVV
jgi:hypothetical protein